MQNEEDLKRAKLSDAISCVVFAEKASNKGDAGTSHSPSLPLFFNTFSHAHNNNRGIAVRNFDQELPSKPKAER